MVISVYQGFFLGLAPFKTLPRVIGGRYGLSSKEFTPAMVKGIFDEMDKETPKNHFTVGIIDDVGHTNLDWDPTYEILRTRWIQAMFFGLGADGTVSANKNSIKIIGEETENFAQGYFNTIPRSRVPSPYRICALDQNQSEPRT